MKTIYYIIIKYLIIKKKEVSDGKTKFFSFFLSLFHVENLCQFLYLSIL